MAASCEECYKGFSTSSNLKRHVKEKHGSQEDKDAHNSYACVLCEKKFQRQDHLKYHVDHVHSQGHQLQCDKCNFKTYEKETLSGHKCTLDKQDQSSTMDPQETYKCTKCPKSFKIKSFLECHIKVYHETKSIGTNFLKTTTAVTCEKCHKDFSKLGNLRRHIQEKHSSEENIDTPKVYACVLCDKKFKRKDNLKYHTDHVHSQGNQLQCDKCNFKTFKKEILSGHNCTQDKDQSNTGGTQEMYKCTKCPKSYKLKSFLNCHMKVKHETKSTNLLKTAVAVKCEKCQKEFTKLCNLRRHIQEKHASHENIDAPKVYACVLCDKKFKRKDNLKYHTDHVHSQENQLQCDKCNFKTFKKEIFSRHNAKHDKQDQSRGTKGPHKCTKCPKSYKLKCSLAFHIKVKHENRSTHFLKSIKRCPLCGFTECDTNAKKTLKNMLEHFTKHHEVSLSYEEFHFESIEEFNRWKSELESETNSKYNLLAKKSDKYMKFVCHRSGIFKSKGRGKRSMKICGSSKINGFCPASLTLDLLNSGKVRVVFLKNHVGHTNDPKFVSLSKADREWIAASVALNMPYEEILRNIRKDVPDSNIKRLHLITRKDIYNIAKGFNLDEYIHAMRRIRPKRKKTKPDSPVVENTSLDNTQLQDTTLKEISEKSNSEKNVLEEKKKFINQFCSMIEEEVTSLEKLEAVINHCKPILNILNGIESSPIFSAPTIVDNTPTNKNVIPQRKFFSTLKRKPNSQGTRKVKRVKQTSIQSQVLDPDNQDTNMYITEGDVYVILNDRENGAMVEADEIVETAEYDETEQHLIIDGQVHFPNPGSIETLKAEGSEIESDTEMTTFKDGTRHLVDPSYHSRTEHTATLQTENGTVQLVQIQIATEEEGQTHWIPIG